MDKSFKLSEDIVRKVLSTVDAGLSNGLGKPIPGEMCVEAAVCYALGLPHGDDPQCVNLILRSLKIRMNDSAWSSKEARAAGLRKLAVLQLGTKDNFDEALFNKRVVIMLINTTISDVLEMDVKKRFGKEAEACRKAKTLGEAKNAANAATTAARAANAAANAAYAAYAANAAYAATYAANAATYAAYAANAATYAANAKARDEVLAKFCEGVCQILIDMKVPAVKYLFLIDGDE